MTMTSVAPVLRRVRALRLVRKMRGRSQSHVLSGDDCHFYVVKFRNHPSGSRVLVNEVLGAMLMRQLGFTCPTPALIEITPTFIAENPDVGISVGRSCLVPDIGL